MIRLDRQVLADLGLGGVEEYEAQAILRGLYELIELRVGTRLANITSPAALREFERYVDNNNDQMSFEVLESQIPNYREIVQQVFSSTIGEFAQRLSERLEA